MSSAIASEVGKLQDRRALFRRLATPLLLLAFSLYYFADVLLRATEKYFWFDEIVTLSVARFTNFFKLWDALRHGVDFNPPLFYMITGASEAVFGHNLIGPRVPEMIGFWVFCLCLFRVVNRRAGLLAGLIAMVLPTITGAFFYAYEARAHGLVLGFAGLCIACWQMTLDQPRRRRWVFGFGLSLFGALMMNTYALVIAVPFGIVELVDTVRLRRINWPMWIALIAPAFIACLLYIPLLHSYRAITKGTEWSQGYMTNLGQLSTFYRFLLLPCILFFMWSFAALAAKGIIGSDPPKQLSRERIQGLTSEVILAVSFLALPIFGFILAKAVHGHFVDRYFISVTAGICMLLGIAIGTRQHLNWIVVTLAVLLAFPVGWQFSALLWHRYHHVPEQLEEPSSGFTMNVSLNGPLSRYTPLLPKDTRIVGVLKFYDFLYLLHYAPELRSRLYYVEESDRDFFEAGFANFHPWSEFKYNYGVNPKQFVGLAPRSSVIGETYALESLARIVKAGAKVTALRVAEDDDHFVADLQSLATPQNSGNGATIR